MAPVATTTITTTTTTTTTTTRIRRRRRRRRRRRTTLSTCVLSSWACLAGPTFILFTSAKRMWQNKFMKLRLQRKEPKNLIRVCNLFQSNPWEQSAQIKAIPSCKFRGTIQPETGPSPPTSLAGQSSVRSVCFQAFLDLPWKRHLPGRHQVACQQGTMYHDWRSVDMQVWRKKISKSNNTTTYTKFQYCPAAGTWHLYFWIPSNIGMLDKTSQYFRVAGVLIFGVVIFAGVVIMSNCMPTCNAPSIG